MSVTVDERAPQVFVSHGSYKNGKLYLNLINKSKAQTLTFSGNLRTTEKSETQLMNTSIALSGEFYQTVEVPLGYIFDIGFSVIPNNGSLHDAMYLADGPWGIDYLNDEVNVGFFDVLPQESILDDKKYSIERGVSLFGNVKGTINTYRTVLPGDQTLDVSEYENLEFTIKNNVAVEVIIVTDQTADWNDRFIYQLPTHNEATAITINFEDFKSANPKISIANIKTLVFSIQGDFNTYKDFSFMVKEVAFSNTSKIDIDTNEPLISINTIMNYPNPFSDVTTIRLPITTQVANLSVIDMTGRYISQKTYRFSNEKEKNIKYKSKQMIQGIYKYVLIIDDDSKYVGTFVIN